MFSTGIFRLAHFFISATISADSSSGLHDLLVNTMLPTTPPRLPTGTPSDPPGAPRKKKAHFSMGELRKRSRSPSPTQTFLDRRSAGRAGSSRDNGPQSARGEHAEVQQLLRNLEDINHQSRHDSLGDDMTQDEEAQILQMLKECEEDESQSQYSSQPLPAERRTSLTTPQHGPASPEMLGEPQWLDYGYADIARRKTKSQNTGSSSVNRNVEQVFPTPSRSRSANFLAAAKTPESAQRHSANLGTPPPTVDRPIATPSRSTPSSSQQSLNLPPEIPSGMCSESIRAYISHLESEVARKTRQLTALQKSKEHLQNEVKTLREEADRKAKFCEGCRKSM